MARFLCAGDLHLDAGSDLGRAPGDRLREQADVWWRVLEIGREEDVDAVLFAGDAFDKARPTPEALLAFERPLIEQTTWSPDRIIAIPGNHDVAGAATVSALDVFWEAGLLTLASTPRGIPAFVDGVWICCLPWAPTARIVAAANGGDRDQINEQAAALLLDAARGLRARFDGPAILLTHFSISGSALPNGLPVDQLREPVLDLAAFQEVGFDAIVAGHIHRPQWLKVNGLDAARPDFYVGSPMPLNFGEADDAHGVTLLDTEEWTATFIQIESRPLVRLSWTTQDGDRPPLAFTPDVVDGAIVKVAINATPDATRRIDLPALKRDLEAAGAHKVAAIEVTVAKVDRGRIEGLTEELTEIEALDAWMNAEGVNGTQAEALRDKTTSYLEGLRS